MPPRSAKHPGNKATRGGLLQRWRWEWMRLKERRESKDLRIPTGFLALPCFPDWLSQWVAWNVCRSWLLRKREGALRKAVGDYIHDKLEMWAKRKGRPQQVVYYRGIGIGEGETELISEDWLLGFLAYQIPWTVYIYSLMSKLFSSFIIKHTVNQYQETCL